MENTANNTQIGGDHYHKHGETGEQHWDRAHRIGLDYFQAQITKYVERCWDKNGIQDLEKAKHFIEKYIELSSGRKGKAQISIEQLNRAVSLIERIDNGGWIGCGECDPAFACHNGNQFCLRNTPPRASVVGDDGEPGADYVDQARDERFALRADDDTVTPAVAHSITCRKRYHDSNDCTCGAMPKL